MLNITQHCHDETCRLDVNGELALDTVEPFLSAVRSLPAGCRRVEFDCRGLKFIDSTGVKVFLQAVSNLHDAGLRSEILNLSPELWEMLDIMGFFEAIPPQS